MSHTAAHKRTVSQTSKTPVKKQQKTTTTTTTTDDMEVAPTGEAPTPLTTDEFDELLITKRDKTPVQDEHVFLAPVNDQTFGATSTMLALMDQPTFVQVTQQNPDLIKQVTTGGADYLTVSAKLTVASSPEEILLAAWNHPDPTDPKLWAAIGKKLAIMPGTWSEILGRTAHRKAKFADKGLRQSIRTFCTEHGLDFADYENALTSEGYTLLGPGWYDEGLGLAVATGNPKDSVRNLVVAQLENRHKAAKAGKMTADEIGVIQKSDDPAQRALDRLAWVVANLRSTRQCVAVAKLQSEELRLFANVPDRDMEADFQSLLNAATEGVDKADQLTKALFDQLVNRKDRKGDLTEMDVRDTERRLRKTLTYLQQLSDQWQNMRVIAHTKTFSGKGNKKVHAETQLGATAIRKHDLDTRRASKVELKKPAKQLNDPPGLSGVKQAIADVTQTAESAELDGRLQQTEIAIGISKLCCFYCWLMLGALAKTKDMTLTISQTHFRTYEWPVPTSLTTKDILAAYLGLSDIPEDGLTQDQADLLAHLDTDEGRAAAISTIKATVLDKKGNQRTEYPSSDEEGDTAPSAYTLSMAPPADQVLAKQVRLAKARGEVPASTVPLHPQAKKLIKPPITAPQGVKKTAKTKQDKKKKKAKTAAVVTSQMPLRRSSRAAIKEAGAQRTAAIMKTETRTDTDSED